jgi:hypothetical protein
MSNQNISDSQTGATTHAYISTVLVHHKLTLMGEQFFFKKKTKHRRELKKLRSVRVTDSERKVFAGV